MLSDYYFKELEGNFELILDSMDLDEDVKDDILSVYINQIKDIEEAFYEAKI